MRQRLTCGLFTATATTSIIAPVATPSDAFFHAQIDFHQRQLEAGNIGRVINEPAVEIRTLKSWFASLDSAEYRVIRTRLFSSIDEIYEFQKDEGAIVAKLDWGGGGPEHTDC